MGGIDILFLLFLSKILKLVYSLVLDITLVPLAGLPQSLPTYFLFVFGQEELDLIDRDDEQKFLTSADFLATSGMPSLISNMQSAVKEVLKG